MSTKRPSNGPDLSYRRSNLRSRGHAWRQQLAQGDDARDQKAAVRAKQEREQVVQKERKEEQRRKAHIMDLEHGFVADKPIRNDVPEWKKQKQILAQLFPDPIVSRIYKDCNVFKNRQNMQGYLRRAVTSDEWEYNELLLAELLTEHFKEQTKSEQPIIDRVEIMRYELSDSKGDALFLRNEESSHLSMQPLDGVEVKIK